MEKLGPKYYTAFNGSWDLIPPFLDAWTLWVHDDILESLGKLASLSIPSRSLFSPFLQVQRRGPGSTRLYYLKATMAISWSLIPHT